MQVSQISVHATVNAAMLVDFADTAFMMSAVQQIMQETPPCIISDSPEFLKNLNSRFRFSAEQFQLANAPLNTEEVMQKLREAVVASSGYSSVIVDMSWGVATVHGVSSYDAWSRIAEHLAAEIGAPVISVYNKEQMIEEHAQAAMRAHQQFLAPSGIYENPFWVPAAMQEESTLDEQLAFMLGRVVPDYGGSQFFREPERQAARGASPDWLREPGIAMASTARADRWHIHCLGRLTVFTGGHEAVDWHIQGGAPKKTKALFAYLLHNGEKGVHADRISEFLWSAGNSEKGKRARLHHTVAMLRKVLGGTHTVVRTGEYYQLNIPTGSWLDIRSFEQMCRRAIALARHGKPADALPMYFAAERLYTGELFEDLGAEYVNSEQEEWCLPRRTWLRGMAIRVFYEMAKLLRLEGRNNEALVRTQRALSLDPCNEQAHIETMEIFFAQGRIEAMHRQFKMYRTALACLDEFSEGEDIKIAYQTLCKKVESLSQSQKKSQVMSLG